MKQTMQKITFLTTGGTIDKTYDEGEGSLENRKSPVAMMASKLRLPYKKIEVKMILNKDSLEMTAEDRQLIADSIANEMKQNNNPIIVIHGTDTMDQTIKFVYQQITNPLAPIVFTGAMRPLEMAENDGLQNITEAIMAAGILPPGIYLSFHSTIFNAPHLVKNKKTGTFEYCK